MLQVVRLFAHQRLLVRLIRLLAPELLCNVPLATTVRLALAPALNARMVINVRQDRLVLLLPVRLALLEDIAVQRPFTLVVLQAAMVYWKRASLQHTLAHNANQDSHAHLMVW